MNKAITDKKKVSCLRYVRITLTYIIVLGTLLPLVWLLTTALKTRVEAFAMPPVWIFTPTFENFSGVLSQGGFMSSYVNSLIIVLGTTFLSVLFGVTSGYALARPTTRVTRAMGTWIILVRMAPPIGFALPFFLLFQSVNLLDTYPALVLVYLTITLPFVTWIMAGYLKSIPIELEESARVDGCTRVQALFRIILPSALPGIATSAIFSFIMSWNEFFYPLVIAGNNTRTASVSIQGFISESGTNWGELAAASILVLLPVFVFTLFAQKGLMGGLTQGSLK